jgi:hypothetical protein
VILGSDDSEGKLPPSEPVSPDSVKDDLPETVILTTGKEPTMNFDVSQQNNFAERFSRKKETLSPSQREGQIKKALSGKKKDILKDEDFLTETVILKSDSAEDKEFDDE